HGEYIRDSGPDLLVGVQHAGAFVVVDVADGQAAPQLAALGDADAGGVHPPGHQVQFGLADGALDPQHEPVVEFLQVVDPVSVSQQGVSQQGVGQAGQLQQPGEIRRAPRQPGHFQDQDDADLADTDPSDKLPQTGA